MIFDEQIARKPDYYPFAKKFAKTMHENFWTHHEFNFQSDIQDFRVKMSNSEQEMIINSLAAIGQIETPVKQFWASIGKMLPHPSIQDLGFVLANTEVVHADAYSNLIEVLGLEDAFEDILKLPVIKGRISYLRKHANKFNSDNRKQFLYSLTLFTLFVENISLFSQFYIVSWFGRYKNILKNTNKMVEYTSREENLHAICGVEIINRIKKEHPELFDKELEDKIISESHEAVKYEFQIIDWIMKDFKDENLTPEIVKEFIKNRMNKSLTDIGYDKIFDIDYTLVEQAKWFDELLLGNNSTDFFDSRPVEYTKNNRSFDVAELF